MEWQERELQIKIRSEMNITSDSVKVTSVAKKIRENGLKWNGHVTSRGEGHTVVIRRMADAPLPGKRHRGRQKARWKD